jgi:hypothetical protein
MLIFRQCVTLRQTGPVNSKSKMLRYEMLDRYEKSMFDRE